MTAHEARLKAQSVNAKSEVGSLAHLVDYARTRIRAAAERGEFVVDGPIDGLRTPISPSQRTAVYEQLRRDGFEVTDMGGGRVAVRW